MVDISPPHLAGYRAQAFASAYAKFMAGFRRNLAFATILGKTDLNRTKAARPMPFLIFFFMISLPVIEVASIVEVSRLVGPLVTFLLLAASVAFGAFLIRSQSIAVVRRVMEAMQSGTPPEEPLLDSGSIMFAGVLFMIPGFVTDILGLFLLLPEARRWIWRGASFALRGRRQTSWTRVRPGPPPKPRRSADVIDAEFTEVPKDRDSRKDTDGKESPWGKP